MMVLIIMALIDEHIKYNLTYTGAVLATGIVGVIQAVNLFSIMRNGTLLQAQADMINKLPLGGLGFSWVVPALIGAVVFAIIGVVTKGKKYGDPL